MKKFITVLLMALLCAALCVSAYAADAGFNAALDIEKGENHISVTVTDSSVLQEKKPSLLINCTSDFDGALLLFDGKAAELKYDTDKGGVSFTVAEGGTYHIVKRLQPSLTVAPGCTTAGSETYSFQSDSYVLTVPETGHDFTDTGKATCANCSEPNPDYVAPIIPSLPSVPSTPPTTTEKVENADGSITTTVTDNKTGEVTMTTETAEGVSATVKTDAEGNVSEISAEIPKGTDTSAAVELPIELSAADEPQLSITTNSAKPVTVAIPVTDATPGTVAVLVDAEGNETVIAETTLTDGGIAAPVPDGATIKIVDNSVDFEDISEDEWHSNAVDFVSARGIMNGTGGDKFDPKSTTTRAMVWTMLARLDGVDTSAGSNWYEAGQKWAMENGISDGTNASAEVTREQLVTMIWRYLGEPESDHDLSGYDDHHETSDWAKAAKQWAVEMGVIKGVTDTILDPGGDATRAQVAQMFMNFLVL